MTKKIRKLLIPAIALLLALSLVSLKLTSREGMNTVEAVLVEATAPLQRLLGLVFDSIGRVWHGYVYLVGLREENQRLRSEIDALQAQLNQYREAYLANQRLRQLLNFKKSTRMEVLPAEVVAFDPSGWFQTIIIDKGEDDGVSRDMAVVSAAGLVGRVIGVGGHYAKVILVLDRNSAVDVLVQRSRARGILVGRGDGRCHLKYVQRNEDVQKGDVVITSGMGGIFPKGIVVGRVAQVFRGNAGLFQEVEVTPVADFHRLEEVLVVLRSPVPAGAGIGG